MNQSRNIILIGDGQIGSSFAFNCLTLGVGRHMGIIDVNHDQVQGDVEDLRDALPYTSQQNIYAADYDDCNYADLIVITAGTNRKPGQTRLDLIKTNVSIIKQIALNIMQTDFQGVILVASNPVDIMTEVVFQITGLPRTHVLGTGTALDTARLRSKIAQRFNVDARSVSGYILGEHGDTGFPVWDATNIGSKPIREWLPDPIEDEVLTEIAKDVKIAAGHIIQKKGATYYGIAASLTRISAAILDDDFTPMAMSVHLTGEYGLTGVSLGVPAIIGANGLDRIIELDLNPEDLKKLHHSADVLKDMMPDI